MDKIEYNRIYRLKNKQRRNAYDREYYKKHKDVIKKRSLVYHKNHPKEKLKSTIKYLKKYGESFNMSSFEYDCARKAWSRAINKRDKTCQICKSKNKLHAHHIFHRQFYPQLSLNLNNGIILCKSCHTELHGFVLY
ncbi:hypothetical protein LCGC14_1353670 [marine sediment metagenome]|uniref:HNH nuclease domain-containing protein n=1 Tax=marine sediment metagenome TaxID=412755 RepID=A0A0F9KA28_9ZZZZ